MIYIDGYNLYYGLRSAYQGRYKWLDLQALSESFLQEDTELIGIKYFTAITKSLSESKNRQEIYLKALTTHCHKLEIIYGRFLKKIRRCKSCGNEYVLYEEKKTDVNLACQILGDAYSGCCDYFDIVSGDSDLVPPVKMIRENFPDKQVIIACPPKRKSQELCLTANGYFAIGKDKIRNHPLPSTIISQRGDTLNKPDQWNKYERP